MSPEFADYALEVLVAILGGAGFAVVFKIPPRYFFHATFLAMAAKLGVQFLAPRTEIVFATFVVSFIVAVISHLFARRTGKPAQAFLIPGVMYLVSGTSLFKSFEAGFAGDYKTGNMLLSQAVAATTAISFALLLANWIIPSRRML